LPDANKAHLIFLTKEDIKYRTCLGHVGRASGGRFCVANRMEGFSHCGVATHAARSTGSSKFVAQGNAFYINGGGNQDRPTARKDPFVHVDDVPARLRGTFERGLKTSSEWTSVFVDTLDDVGNDIERRSSTSRSQRSQELSEDDGVVLEEEDYEQGHEAPELELEFEWTGMIEEALCGEPSPSHRTALDLLKDRYNASDGRLRAQREEMHVLRGIIEKRGRSNDDHLRRMGQLDKLIQKHGTVARAIEEALDNGTATGLVHLQEQISELWQDLEQAATDTMTTKTTLLKLLTRVRVTHVNHVSTLKDRVKALENQLHVGRASASVAIPLGFPSATMISRVAGIDADTVFGVGQVGGVDVDLSINSLFCLVTTLEAKVQILSERAKNTGVLFHDVAYASEKEFALAYHPANSSGQGSAGFVDIISIWNFATIDHGDSGSWLTEQKNAKSVGYTHALDAKYAYSMGVRYPSAFAGSDKEDITSTSTIKMLKSIVTWRGNGLGDGYKEKLTESMTQAIRSHKKYCDDFVPKGWLREHALRSGQYTQYFWQMLSAYIEEEISMLSSFSMLEKNICLLMSNQVVQICDDLAEFRSNARNVAVDNLETGARYAWVTLQSLNCMESYLKAQFRRHQGINATFMRFLTRTMADQTAAGSKASTDSLTKQVKKLQDEHATTKALEKLGEKLEAIIKANNLKRTPG
jgi:hypothetical protein